MTNQTADRPFADEPTEVLRTALGLATRHAEQAAHFRLAQPGDALPAVVDLLRAELQHREGTLLPPPEGPEYTPCRSCTHIEPEHQPDAGPCLVCDCRAYAPAAVSAAVAPPTNPTHGLSVPHADALWDAVAIPGPRTPTYPEQHERVCRAVRDILDELTPARDDAVAQTALRDRIADKLTAAAYECDGKCGLSERECYDAHPITVSAMAGGTAHVDGSVTAIADAVLAVLPSAADWDALVREADRLRRDGKALHARAEEIDTQLAALRQQVTEPADKAAVLRDFLWRLEQSAGDAAAEKFLDDNPELRRMADETATETQARRGDAFEQWLKARRDEWAPEGCQPWQILDQTLEEYRLHADTGTPLGEHVCEGKAVGDCECLEQPAAGARQDGAET